MRAGLQRGVNVRVDQDPEKPGTIIVEVLNPVDRSKELAERLAGIAKRKKPRAKPKKGEPAKEEPKKAGARALNSALQ